MAGHPQNIDAASFEPGVNAAPWVLAAKFRGMGVAPEGEPKWQERMKTSEAVVRALHQPLASSIVPGSDTGLIGYGLDRELELYVLAGFTPMEAIMAATSVSAKAMKMERDVGTVEVGKRADLVLVDGNPLENISNLRHVVWVVSDGRMYSSAKLAPECRLHPLAAKARQNARLRGYATTFIMVWLWWRVRVSWAACGAGSDPAFRCREEDRWLSRHA